MAKLLIGSMFYQGTENFKKKNSVAEIMYVGIIIIYELSNLVLFKKQVTSFPIAVSKLLVFISFTMTNLL